MNALLESLSLQQTARMDDILQTMYNAHAVKEISEAKLLELAFQDDNIFYYLAGRHGSEGVSNWIYKYHRDVPIVENLGGLPPNTIEVIGAQGATSVGTTITFRPNMIPYGFHLDSVFFHNDINYVVSAVNGHIYTIRVKEKSSVNELIGTSFLAPTPLQLAAAFGYLSVADAQNESTSPSGFGAVLYGTVIEEGADKTNFHRSPTQLGQNLLTIQQYYVGQTDLQSIQSMEFEGSEWQRNFRNMMTFAARNRERLLFIGAGHVSQAAMSASSGLAHTSGLVCSETRGLLNGGITKVQIGNPAAPTTPLTYNDMFRGIVDTIDEIYEGKKTVFNAIGTNDFITNFSLWAYDQATAARPIKVFENNVYGIKATGFKFGAYELNIMKSPVYNQIRNGRSSFVVIDHDYVSVTHGAGNGKSLKSVLKAEVQPDTANMTWLKYYDTSGLKNIREEATMEFTFNGRGW